MQSLEAACEEGEVSIGTCIQCNQKSNNFKANMVCTHTRTFKKTKQSRTPLPLQPIQETVPIEIQQPRAPFCIYTKLKELYYEENGRYPNQNATTGLKSNSHLLEKLVAHERLNTLILNLYPGNKGYSLSFPTVPNSEVCIDDTAEVIETIQWPYEEKKLLEYIDNEEVPAFFVDLLEPQCGFLFYSGCIVAEIRDYRQAFPDFKCDIRYVLLKPSLESILADINIMLDEKVEWGNEEKIQLESQLILANNPRLCLEPTKNLNEMVSNVNHNKQLFNTHKLRRTAQRYSQVSVNRKRLLDKFTHKHGAELHDYLTKLRNKSRTGLLPEKVPRRAAEEVSSITVPNFDFSSPSAPSTGVTINEYKAYQRPPESTDCLPQLVEGWILETDIPSKERGKSRVYHIQLSVLQRPSNLEYLGELYLDRDYKKGEQNGVSCRFPFASKVHSRRYVNQFNEIFTEGGRKTCRFTHVNGVKDRLTQLVVPQANTPQQATQTQAQPCTSPLVNGSLNVAVQQPHTSQNTSSVPVLQSQLQSPSQKTQAQVNQEIEINALATRLMNSAQQFQAAANAKQQQKLSSSGSNAAIINLLNSSSATNINNDASAAVANAINNAPLVQTLNQKFLGRKITLSNVSNARVLNHNNLITVNSNRVNLQELSQPQQAQTITLTSENAGNFLHGNYIKPQAAVLSQRDSSKSTLSALLVGTPAANRPDIVNTNTNSLLLEKLGNVNSPGNAGQSPTHFIQSPKNTFTVQSPKNNQVLSPMASPPSQNSNTINVQSLNFAPIQNLSGLQNVQVQLPGFSQPISLSLNVSSTGAIQGHPTGLIVSLPVTCATATCTTVTQQSTTPVVTAGNNIVGAPTVVLANPNNSNLAHLVSSGVKSINQQNVRSAGPAGVTLTQGGQPFQLVTQLQRPRMQPATVQQNSARGIQRTTPITIKMATTPNTNTTATPALNQLIMQRQAQLQYQQTCLNNQQVNNASPPQGMPGKVRRRSNVSDS